MLLAFIKMWFHMSGAMMVRDLVMGWELRDLRLEVGSVMFIV